MPDEMKVQGKGLNKKFLFIAITLIGVGLVAALVLLLPTSAKAKKVEEQLNLGAKYLSELNYEQAIVAYEAVIEIDPKCEEAYLALADIYIATGDLEKAEEILKQAEDTIGADATEAVEAKKQEVEKVREEKLAVPTPTETPSSSPTGLPMPTAIPSPTPTNAPTPAVNAIYDGTTVELPEAKVGDVVLLGSYEQDNIESNGAEAIPWYVLDKDGDKLLLLSVYLLDAVPYHEEFTEITWENCTLRQWMNDDFFNSAFTESEKKHILTSYLENEDNLKYGTEGGNGTEDRVFALSLAEAEQYFGIEKDGDWYWRSASPALSTAEVTAYAEAQGAYVYAETQRSDCWWLRSSGECDSYVAHVDVEGSVHVDGFRGDIPDRAARPALWLNLNPSATTTLVIPSPTPSPTPTNTPSPTPTQVPMSGISSEGIEIGAYITFGNYEQDNNFDNGKEAIDWLVLDVQDGKVFLLSRYGLDCKPYNEKYIQDVTWETCTLRSWLNQDFYDTAFSEEEQQAILTAEVKNEDNPYHGSEGGNDTEDKIFLLSIEEAYEYFPEDTYMYDVEREWEYRGNLNRATAPTAYAIVQGAWTIESNEWYGDNCNFWLRSIGGFNDGYVSWDYGYAARGGYNGGVDLDGIYVDFVGSAVRPAMWVKLID